MQVCPTEGWGSHQLPGLHTESQGPPLAPELFSQSSAQSLLPSHPTKPPQGAHRLRGDV